MDAMLRLFSLFSVAPGTVPEWVHLAPVGTFRGIDGRGPYTIADAAAVISLSMQAGKLAIDENHAIDLAAPKGEPSPARGWIVEMQTRQDGIWGRVEWTAAGQALMADQAYRGLSPALVHDKSGRVASIARASLTNNPNLTLSSLHHQEPMMDIAALRKALGLPDTADDAAILAAAATAAAVITTHAAEVAAIAEAAGLDKALKPAALATALQAQRAAGDDVAQLRTTIVSLQTQLETVQASTRRSAAEQAIDTAIKAGKVGLKPLRDHYITRHMADAAGVEKEIAAMPSLHSEGLAMPPAPGATGVAALTADERKTCALMGVDPEAFAKQKALEVELV